MTTLELIGGISVIIISIIVIAIVVMQESKQAGVSIMGGETDSYLSKNRGKTLESKLNLFTKFLTIAFFVVTIVMNVIISNSSDTSTDITESTITIDDVITSDVEVSE